MLKWFLIAGGGAFGSVLRYAMRGWVQEAFDRGFPKPDWPVSFPAGTLAVNVAGCLAIGFLSGLFAAYPLIREEYRIGLTVGVLGGFTTFSAFGYECFSLSEGGRVALAALYVALSCGLGIAAVWIGYRVAERWFGV